MAEITLWSISARCRRTIRFPGPLVELAMVWGEAVKRLLAGRQARLGLGLLVVGECLIVIRMRPFSDFYFPFAWFGFILFLDAAIRAQSGKSLLTSARLVFLALIPLSSLFWWLFEGFDLVVHNWSYVGGDQYTALGFVGFASLDFSTVLLAVWSASALIRLLIPGHDAPAKTAVPGVILVAVFVAGLICLTLPLVFPRYAFGLVWGCTALILDPINAYLGRPSMVHALWNRCWRLPPLSPWADCCAASSGRGGTTGRSQNGSTPCHTSISATFLRCHCLVTAGTCRLVSKCSPWSISSFRSSGWER